jgi:hypothetical protein
MITEEHAVSAYVVGGGARMSQRLGSLNPCRIHSFAGMEKALERADRRSVWVASTERELCRYLKRVREPIRHSLGQLILLSEPHVSTVVFLSKLFQHVALPCPKSAVLPLEELAEVLRTPDRATLAIAASHNVETEHLTVWRGDFQTIVMPTSAFHTGGTGVRPDFDDIAVTDYGNTLRLGRYEAAFDALLYEHDSDYRRNLTKQRRQTEKGFGPSLRRARLQQGVQRADFPGVSDKTIARLERGESQRYSARTRRAIESRLGMDVADIEQY